jgi:hypothetical protein
MVSMVFTFFGNSGEYGKEPEVVNKSLTGEKCAHRPERGDKTRRPGY